MLDVLHDLEAYSGAQHSCVGWKENIIASTVPAEMQDDLLRSHKVVLQLFEGVRKTGHNYGELQLELDRYLLLAYPLTNECMLLLLTRKGVNMALMSTSVRSIREKVLKGLKPAVEKFAASQKGTVASHDNEQPLDQENAAALSDLMNKLCDQMVDFLGSSGAISFYRILNEWKRQYGMDKYKLPALLKQLAAELTDGRSREAFLQDAVLLTRELIQKH